MIREKERDNRKLKPRVMPTTMKAGRRRKYDNYCTRREIDAEKQELRRRRSDSRKVSQKGARRAFKKFLIRLIAGGRRVFCPKHVANMLLFCAAGRGCFRRAMSENYVFFLLFATLSESGNDGAFSCVLLGL